jgi:hypothetical protein
MRRSASGEQSGCHGRSSLVQVDGCALISGPRMRPTWFLSILYLFVLVYDDRQKEGFSQRRS